MNLRGIILDIYGSSGNYGYYFPKIRSKQIKYMEVPINQSPNTVFEVPTFATAYFSHNAFSANVAAIKLEAHKIITYTSLNAILQKGLTNKLLNGGLLKMNPKGVESTYYVTQGAIFNAAFTPVMMCSWQVLIDRSSEEPELIYVTPILRVTPQCFIEKDDAVKRFVVNKFIPEALDTRIHRCDTSYSIRVIIEQCPFPVVKTDTPSILTTDQQLRQIVIDHIDEVLP